MGEELNTGKMEMLATYLRVSWFVYKPVVCGGGVRVCVRVCVSVCECVSLACVSLVCAACIFLAVFGTLEYLLHELKALIKAAQYRGYKSLHTPIKMPGFSFQSLFHT